MNKTSSLGGNVSSVGSGISSILPQSTAPTNSLNNDNSRDFKAFGSLHEYQAYIRDIFINGSQIDPCLVDFLDFASAIETSLGGDISQGIAPRLRWEEGEWKRFTQEARVNFHAAFLQNEDGSDWQAILSLPSEKKPYQYLAPKG